MNFDDAIVAHMRWKSRLTDAIEGKSAEKLDHEGGVPRRPV
jgi:hypothetical protein